MAHFLLAWELGANLGHASRLRSLALRLKRRGHRLTFVLRDVVGARALLGLELGRILQAPLWVNAVAKPAFSLADVLLACGYDTERTLNGLVEPWRGLIELSGCDALVADHAPTALLAARLMGVPALNLGTGFSVPPRETPLPIFRDWAPAPATHAVACDAQALASVNAVLAVAGVSPLQHLWQLFYPEKTLLCTWPEFDHYAGRGRASADYCGPEAEVLPGAAPAWPVARGPRVFAYLRASHPEHAEVLVALQASACATLCFFPDRAASAAAPEASASLSYSTEPVDMQQALATCDLAVCHAGHATVAQAARQGIPCLLLPTQTEQFLVARQMERHGLGINAAALARPVDYAALIAELLRPESRYRVAARAMAERYRSFDPADLTEEIATEVESLLAAQG